LPGLREYEYGYGLSVATEAKHLNGDVLRLDFPADPRGLLGADLSMWRLRINREIQDAWLKDRAAGFDFPSVLRRGGSVRRGLPLVAKRSGVDAAAVLEPLVSNWPKKEDGESQREGIFPCLNRLCKGEILGV